MDGVQVDEEGGGLVVSGQTFPYKEDLKRLGFRWRYAEKCWKHPAASERLKMQVSRILGRPIHSHVPSEPSHINFHSSAHGGDGDSYYANDMTGNLVNVHFVDDDPPQTFERPHVQPSRTRPHRDHVLHQPRQEHVIQQHAYPPIHNRAQQPPPPMQRYRDDYRHDDDRFHRPRFEELYVDQRPAVHLEVFCPSDDDEVYQ